MMHLIFRVLFGLTALFLTTASAGAPISGPQDLSLHILQRLKDPDFPFEFPEEWSRVRNVIATPQTGTFAVSKEQPIPDGQIKVLAYNVLRNVQYTRLEALLTRCDALDEFAKGPLSSKDRKELCALSQSDILLLSEVDRSHCRSEYRDGAQSLARAMNYNYAYGVEFLEVHPKSTGLKDGDGDLCKKNHVRTDAQNQHGNAVLSRFPILWAERLSLPQCHDWFEDGGHQTRRGSRMALITEIQLPAPHSSILAVSTHLENKTDSECRAQQMQTLLSRVSEIEKQKNRSMNVIIGGDMNPVFGSAGSLKRLWKENSYDYSFNKGPTFGLMRLDYIVTKAAGPSYFHAINGDVVDAVKDQLKEISDHSPIYIDIGIRNRE